MPRWLERLVFMTLAVLMLAGLALIIVGACEHMKPEEDEPPNVYRWIEGATEAKDPR